MALALLVAGAVAVVIGAGMLCLAAAVICGGVLAMAGAVALAWVQDRRPVAAAPE